MIKVNYLITFAKVLGFFISKFAHGLTGLLRDPERGVDSR
jgi:hypothetical protein